MMAIFELDLWLEIGGKEVMNVNDNYVFTSL